MAEESPDYKQLFIQEQRKREEEQRKREAAESAQKEAEQGRMEEQRKREEEQRKREVAESAQKEAEQGRMEEQRKREKGEEKIQQTTLPEYLDGCHIHFHSNLVVQNDLTQSTQGNPANAKKKLRPEKLRAWDDFPTCQAAIWNDIMESGFALERHFTSVNTLEDSGEYIKQQLLSSELDLHHFQRETVERPVSAIIRSLYSNRKLRRICRLQGSVSFENHANSLSPEAQLEEGMEQLSVSGSKPRRSPRLQAQAKAKSTAQAKAKSAVQAKVKSAAPRPRADQFCVYNTGTQAAENRVAAFIVEFKAPHKLPLGYIYEGLEDMDLEDVLSWREPVTPKDRFRRLIAAVITQAFSYMISVGLEYGCVCTGEASIFLQVREDPRTVYYYLSVPKGDVGASTGWSSELDRDNRLHLTAVGQMLAFTLQALKTPPRGQKWRNDAINQLNSWEVLYEDLKNTIPEDVQPSSEYRRPKRNSFLRMSPIRLRPRMPLISSADDPPPKNLNESSDEPDTDTPSRQPPGRQQSSQIRPTASSSAPKRRTGSASGTRREAQQGQYCTQECLLGLVNGSTLDLSCPNVQDHGKDRHSIDLIAFLRLIRQQLSEDLDTDCKPVSMPGACGVLFQVRLQEYGYTVAAKATPAYFVHRLKWEAAVYKHLRPIQGSYVPVYLGNIDLEVPYLYDGIAELVHMMLLSFGGKRISQHYRENRDLVSQQVDVSAQALHNLGVLHRDLMPRNMLWNEEAEKVMIIDFDRAKIVEEQPRPALRQISNNRARKDKPGACMMKQRYDDISVFTQERRSVAFELRGLG